MIDQLGETSQERFALARLEWRQEGVGGAPGDALYRGEQPFAGRGYVEALLARVPRVRTAREMAIAHQPPRDGVGGRAVEADEAG